MVVCCEFGGCDVLLSKETFVCFEWLTYSLACRCLKMVRSWGGWESLNGLLLQTADSGFVNKEIGSPLFVTGSWCLRGAECVWFCLKSQLDKLFNDFASPQNPKCIRVVNTIFCFVTGFEYNTCLFVWYDLVRQEPQEDWVKSIIIHTGLSTKPYEYHKHTSQLVYNYNKNWRGSCISHCVILQLWNYGPKVLIKVV